MKRFFPSLKTSSNKVIFSVALSYAIFYIPVIFTYFEYRGLDAGQAFFLFGFYYTLSMLFEYPSGVIGDYFSHRNTVIAGYFLLMIACFLNALPGTFLYYIFLMVLFAFSTSLASGSDTALLHKHSTNFKKDLANMGFYRLISLTAALFIGGFAASFHLTYPILLQVFTLAISIFTLLSIPNTQAHTIKHAGNLYHAAKEGLRYSWRSQSLRWSLMLTGIFIIFLHIHKFLYNPLFEATDITILFWGTLAAIFTVLRATGMKTYSYYSSISLTPAIILFSLSLLGTAFTFIPAVAITSFCVFSFIFGYIETKCTVIVNNHAPEQHRASVLSLLSLMGRGGSALFMFASGYVLDIYSFSVLITGIAILATITTLFFLYKLKQIYPYKIDKTLRSTMETL